MPGVDGPFRVFRKWRYVSVISDLAKSLSVHLFWFMREVTSPRVFAGIARCWRECYLLDAWHLGMRSMVVVKCALDGSHD